MNRNILFSKAIPFIFLALFFSLAIFANSAFAYTLEDLANSLQSIFQPSQSQTQVTTGQINFFQWVSSLFQPLTSCTCSSHICSSGCMDSGSSCQNPSDCQAASCTPSCSGKPCGSDNGCGSTCQSGSGCTSCTPSCSGKPCGSSNGCGSICQSGSGCTQQCTPSCAGKQCGPNGCGGSCGTCSSGTCSASGQCQTSCTPSCSGKSCGASDGCGGTCKTGSCPTGQNCVNGICQTSGGSCTDTDGGQILTQKGTCTSKSSTSTDSCYGDTVREFYCSSSTSTICSSYDTYCPTYCTNLGYKSGKCSDGACVCESGTSGKPSCDPNCGTPAPMEGCTKSTGGECTYPSTRYYCEKTGGCYGQQWDCKVACGYQSCGIQGSDCGGSNPNCCDGFTCDTTTSKCVSNKPSCGTAGGRCVNSQTECTNFCGTNKQADYKTGYDCTNGCCSCLSKVQCTKDNQKINCAAYGSGECIVGACDVSNPDNTFCYGQPQTGKTCTTTDGKSGNCDSSGKCIASTQSQCPNDYYDVSWCYNHCSSTQSCQESSIPKCYHCVDKTSPPTNNCPYTCIASSTYCSGTVRNEYTCGSSGVCCQTTTPQEGKENCKNKEANVKYCSALNAVEAGWVCKSGQGQDTNCNKGQCEYKIIISTFCSYGCDNVKGECNSAPATAKCSDGTELDQCSATKPMKCTGSGNVRNLVPDCNKCGCPDPTTQYCTLLSQCSPRLDNYENCNLDTSTISTCSDSNMISSTYGKGCKIFGQASDNCPKGNCGYVKFVSRVYCSAGCDSSTGKCKPESPTESPPSGPNLPSCLTLKDGVCRVACLDGEDRLQGLCPSGGKNAGQICCKLNPTPAPGIKCVSGNDVADVNTCLPGKPPKVCRQSPMGSTGFMDNCNMCECPDNWDCNTWTGSCSPKVLNSQISAGTYQYGIAAQNILTLIIPIGSKLNQPIVVSGDAYTNYNVLSSGSVKAITFMWDPEFKVITNTYEVSK